MLCYLRLHGELALRAKGMLLMRESGIDDQLDDETRAKLAELESSSAALAARDSWHCGRCCS